VSELSERHEIRVRGKDHTIVFLADSGEDGGLVIRQEPAGKKSGKEVCSITISDPDELRSLFEGLRRILSSLGHTPQIKDSQAVTQRSRGVPDSDREEQREAAIAKARQKNPQAFAPWSREEEQEVSRRFKAGEAPQAIARAHRRSPRAIELRLQRMGLMPSEEEDSARNSSRRES